MNRIRSVMAAAIAVTATATLTAATPAAATGLAPDAYISTATGYTHWVGELDRGSDLEHYADWVLDRVGVDEGDRAARIPPGGIMNELSMVWLLLTAAEADRANGLIGQSPLNTAEVAHRVSVPTPVDVTGTLASPGHSGRQVVPTGVARIGTPVEQWEQDRRPPSMAGIRVAVIDTGIDARHPGLNVVDGFNCSMDQRGPDGWGIDLHGHGTATSSAIGAIHNDEFIVAPAQGVALVDAITFGAGGSASSAMVLCALNQALESGADVINASLGGTHLANRCGGTSVYTNGWCKAGARAIVVVAAGNDAINAIYKGPANVPNVVTVGAIADFDGEPGGEGVGFPGCGLAHRDDHLAIFSNWGPTVDVVAPGACLLGLLPNESWGYWSGTSAASPHVAGVIANFIARYPGCEGHRAVQAVLAYAGRDEFADDQYTGWPTADPPPLIRYVLPERERTTQPDADPCRIPREAS